MRRLAIMTMTFFAARGAPFVKMAMDGGFASR